VISSPLYASFSAAQAKAIRFARFSKLSFGAALLLNLRFTKV